MLPSAAGVENCRFAVGRGILIMVGDGLALLLLLEDQL